MKNYEKPVVMVNEELAEGVYAASGDCFTLSVEPTIGKGTSLTDGKRHFTVTIGHGPVLHISTASTVVVTFNSPIKEAYAQNYTCSINGCTVTIVRESHSNSYNQYDESTYLLEVAAFNDDLSSALAVTDKSITCTSTVNVQGQY